MSEKENFKVVIASKAKEEDTIILTSQEQAQQWLEQAMYNFNNNYHQYSAHLNENSLGKTTITNEEIDALADNPQSNLNKIKQINSYSRYYINKDDLIGKIYETIENNVNTDYKVSFRDFSKNKGKLKTLEKTRDLIDSFNRQINLKQLLRKSIPLTYTDGNYPLYLRKNGKGNYTVDYYPLGVIEVSDYEVDGEPILLVNVKELTSRLQKPNLKNKNGTKLFFDNIEDELKSNYPEEVYLAYKNKEAYAKLNVKNSGILRINNMNKKYGVTPIFRTLKSAMMLETFEKTDRINAKAKAKKIIFQKLHKEIMGQNWDNPAFEQMSYAHDSFMTAWKNETVIYTGAAFVEDIKYIEPKVETVNIDSLNNYRSKIMTALGIGFLNQDSKQTYSTATLSITELMKNINKITQQLEDILQKWYKVLLEDNNISLEFCPDITIVDSEQMSIDVKKDLVELLYSKLNCSLETAYSLLGISLEDEKQKRQAENDDKLEEVFAPRQTNYTFTDKGKSGAPVDNNNPDKQIQDQERRGTV